jgi:hypothetical protein
LEAEFLIAADLNGDHKSDILFTRSNDSQIYTMLGNGDGTFQSPQLSTGGVPNLWPVVADFNGDGHLDVAVTAGDRDLLNVLLGNGDGTFQSPIGYPTGDGPQSPVVTDFNLDGNLDIAVSVIGAAALKIFPGRGDGTFDSPITTTSSNPTYSAAGDLNRDGKPDLVLGGDGLKVFLGNGDGTFQSPQTVYATYGPVQIADVDRDGRFDIVVSGGFDVLAVLRGQGYGTFRPAVEFSTGSLVGFFVLKDLDHDRLPEAIVSDLSTLTVLANTSHAE